MPNTASSSRDWMHGQQINLQRLTASVLVREHFEPSALALVKRVDKMAKDSEIKPTMPGQISVPAFSDLYEQRSGSTFRAVAGMALDLYKTTVDSLPKALGKKIGSLSDTSLIYENRSIHKAAKEIESMAVQLQRETDPQTRERGQALWLSSRLLAATAPPADQSRVGECAFCHRHTSVRNVCAVHRLQGNYKASITQRERYAASVREGNVRLMAYLNDNPKEADALLATGENAKSLAALVRLGQAVLDADARKSLNTAIEVAGGPESAMDRIVAAWHSLPLVEDREGLSQVAQSPLSNASMLATHLVRLDAYLRLSQDDMLTPQSPRGARPDTATGPDGSPVKRGPGRPRKGAYSTPPQDGPRRGPGRPRKVANVSESTQQPPAVKRGPGRPRNEVSVAPPATRKEAKRGPGRPRKVDAVAYPVPQPVALKRGPARSRHDVAAPSPAAKVAEPARTAPAASANQTAPVATQTKDRSSAHVTPAYRPTATSGKKVFDPSFIF